MNHLIVSLSVTLPGLAYALLGALQMHRWRRGLSPVAWRRLVAEMLRAAERDGLVVVYDLDRWGTRHYHLEKGVAEWSHPYLIALPRIRKTMPLPQEENEQEREPAGGGGVA